ncbi:MAG: hypothetical protein HOQ07_14160 [Sinomonas sp.]|nr:hypothetical protein [Sinomonas sp.]
MKFPFVWRKTAEDELQIWKAEAARQRKRANSAVRVARTELANRRTIAELFSDLTDSYMHVVVRNRELTAAAGPAKARPALDKAKARASADRIAELPRASARARAYVAAQAAENGADS